MPFELLVDTPGYWKHNRIAWAGASKAPQALVTLVDSLRSGLTDVGVHFDPKPFVTHVTLVRDARRADPMPMLDPVRWPVSSFALVRSAGGRYEVVASWPLAQGRSGG